MGLREFITYIQVVRRRWKLIVGLFLGTMVTLVAISIFAPRVYPASARLQIMAPSPGMITLYDGFPSDGFRDEIAYTRDTFIEILNSKVVARRTLKAVDTRLDLEELQKRTEIEVESDFIKLTVTGDRPDEAAQLANGLAAEALAYYGELLARSSGASRAFISAQLELARQDLDRAQMALMQFKIENKVGSLDSDISQQTSFIRSLRRSRDDAIANNDITKANAYDVLIAQREQELQTLLNLSAQYQALQMTVAQASSTYDYLLGKEAEAKITENETRNVSFVQVVEPAEPPSKSTSTFSKSILAWGGVLSLVVCTMLAFVLDYAQGKQVYPAHEMLEALPETKTTPPIRLEFRRRLSDAWQVAKTWQGILAFISVFLTSIILPILAAEAGTPLGGIREGIVAYVSHISVNNDATTTYRSIGETSFVVNDTMIKDIAQPHHVTDTSQISIKVRVQDADGETISDDEISCEWIFDPLLPEQTIGEKDGCQISYQVPENLDSQLVEVKVQGKDITQIAGASTNFINLVLQSDKGASNE
jgi:uncharacterized protein involved in exopolysaccharide biosynthesis